MAAATVIGIVGAIAAIAGTVATIEASNQQAEQAEKEAILKEQQSKEIGERQKINEQVLLRRAYALQAAQQSKFASAGVNISTGAPLQVMAKLYEDLELDIQSSRREANFNAYVLGEEASARRSFGSGVRTLGYVKGGATLLQGAESSYKLADPKG